MLQTAQYSQPQLIKSSGEGERDEKKNILFCCKHAGNNERNDGINFGH